MSSPCVEVVPEISPSEETNLRSFPSHKTKLRIDNIIVDVTRHREGALNYANNNLACLPHVEYPTRTDQDL